MGHYAFTQGVRGQDYVVIIKDGEKIPKDDINRRKILDSFIEIENKGLVIDIEEPEIKIVKYKKDILIKYLTENKDAKERRVPIGLLIPNFINSNFTNEDLRIIKELLSDEDVVVKDEIWDETIARVKKVLFLNRTKIFKRVLIGFGIVIALAIIYMIIKEFTDGKYSTIQ